MRYLELLKEDKIADKILRDPKSTKMLNIMWKMDHSVPANYRSSLGPKPDEKKVVELFGKVIDEKLRNSLWGDMSSDSKLDDYIIRSYINGQVDFEDLTGELIDSLGTYKALSMRGLLKPEHQDFNRIPTLLALKKVLAKYSSEIQRMRSEEKIKQMKKQKDEIVLIDDERFFVVIPLNYGSCYIFNNAEGINATFCTGSSSTSWFDRYAKDGAMIMIFDKENPNSLAGKWQIHSATNQLNNANQTVRATNLGQAAFYKNFPGLLKRIAQAMDAKRDEIQEKSKALVPPNGYDVSKEIERLKTMFPIAYHGEAEQER